MFRMHVAKVDRDVAYNAMVVHVYCKSLFSMFYLFFQTYVESVFNQMLQVFYLDVAYVCNAFQVFLGVFSLRVFQTHV
jgi:hypothetical protein